MSGVSVSKLHEVQQHWERIESLLGQLEPALVDLDWAYHPDARCFPVFRAAHGGFNLELQRIEISGEGHWTALVEGETAGFRSVPVDTAVQHLVEGLRAALEMGRDYIQELLDQLSPPAFQRAVCEVCGEPAATAIKDHPRCRKHTFSSREEGMIRPIYTVQCGDCDRLLAVHHIPAAQDEKVAALVAAILDVDDRSAVLGFDSERDAIAAGEVAGWHMRSESIGGDLCPQCVSDLHGEV